MRIRNNSMDPRWHPRLRHLPYLSIPLLTTNMLVLGLSIRFAYKMMSMTPEWVYTPSTPQPPKAWLFTYATVVPVLGIIHALASILHHRLTGHFPPMLVLLGAVAMAVAWVFMLLSWILCEGLGMDADVSGSYEHWCPTDWLGMRGKIGQMDAGWWMKTVLTFVLLAMYVGLIGAAAWTIRELKRQRRRCGGEVGLGKWGSWGRVKPTKTVDMGSVSTSG